VFLYHLESTLRCQLPQVVKLGLQVPVGRAYSCVDRGFFHRASKYAFALAMMDFEGETTGRRLLISARASSKFLHPTTVQIHSHDNWSTGGASLAVHQHLPRPKKLGQCSHHGSECSGKDSLGFVDREVNVPNSVPFGSVRLCFDIHDGGNAKRIRDREVIGITGTAQVKALKNSRHRHCLPSISSCEFCVGSR
jgi:hypothetical protein